MEGMLALQCLHACAFLMFILSTVYDGTVIFQLQDIDINTQIHEYIISTRNKKKKTFQGNKQLCRNDNGFMKQYKLQTRRHSSFSLTLEQEKQILSK